jgi:hypothetical protein
MAANVDAFSTSGFFPVPPIPLPPGILTFALSVDPLASGDVGGCTPFAPGATPPDVATEAAALTDAPADVFALCFGQPGCPLPPGPMPLFAPYAMPNFQILDGNGIPIPPYAPSPPLGLVAEPAAPGAGDDLDAFDGPPVGAYDFAPVGGDGIPDVPVYFSVDPPTAATIGVLPAAVFVTVGGAIGPPYAAPAALGLDLFGPPGSDNLDGLQVADADGLPLAFAPGGGDLVIFSVAPGSAIIGTPNPPACGAALAGYPRGPGDVLIEGTPLGAPGVACVLVPETNMELWNGTAFGCVPNPFGAIDDNIDALAFAPPIAPPPPPPTATPTPTPTGGTPTTTVTPTTTATATASAVIATCTPPPPPAGPTPTPLAPGTGTKCQRAIGKEASKFVQAKMKALQKCEDKKVLGQHTDPCPDAGAAAGSPAKKAADAIGKAISKLTAAIAKKCGGSDKACATTGGGQEDPENLGFFTTCPDFESSGLGNCTQAITTCEHIAECVECIAEEAIDQGMSSIYGSFAASAAGSALNKCQRAIGKETMKFAITKEKNINKCWDALRKGLSVGSTTCPDLGGTPGLAAEKAAQKIKKAEEKKVTKICKACGGPTGSCDDAIDTSLIVPGGAIIPGLAAADDLAPGSIGFMATCPAVTIPGATNCADLDDLDGAGNTIDSLRELILCIDCVHEFKVDCIDAAARPQNQVYPCECNP